MELKDEEWVICRECSSRVKEGNLKNHMKKVHNNSSSSGGIVPFVFIAIVVFLLITAGIYLYVNTDDQENVEEPEIGWLDTYRPKMNYGVQDDDWWVTYPSQNPDYGGAVNHPAWVKAMLKNGPILVFTHSEGCAPCVTQGGDIAKLMKVYSKDIQLMDLLSGSDQKASETFQVYDPNGSPSYIPLTIVITLIEDSSGNVGIGWRSVEGATGLDWLTDHAKDAIFYHHTNSDNWG